VSLDLRVHRVTFFVDDLEAVTAYYRNALGLPAAHIREGWSAFLASKHTEIAFHRGKGRRPRIELVVKGDLQEARTLLNDRGARLGECKNVRGRAVCVGKDRDGNAIQLSAEPSG
jgi:catechol 2,3-dioxygenase-like lactoylglutathione lyase family enzyme